MQYVMIIADNWHLIVGLVPGIILYYTSRCDFENHHPSYPIQQAGTNIITDFAEETNHGKAISVSACSSKNQNYNMFFNAILTY